MLTTLSMVMNAAVDDGLVNRNPCSARSVRAPRPPDRKVVPWTAGQVQAVRDVLPERYRALADVGRWLGLRQGEAFGLAVEDVDFLRRVVHVRRQVKRLGNALVFAPPKGGKDREVPLPNSVGLLLSAHIAAHPPAAVALPWRSLDARPHGAAAVHDRPGAGDHADAVRQKHWHPALRQAGISRRAAERVPCPAAPLRVGAAVLTAWISGRWPSTSATMTRHSRCGSTRTSCQTPRPHARGDRQGRPRGA